MTDVFQKIIGGNTIKFGTVTVKTGGAKRDYAFDTKSQQVDPDGESSTFWDHKLTDRFDDPDYYEQPPTAIPSVLSANSDGFVGQFYPGVNYLSNPPRDSAIPRNFVPPQLQFGYGQGGAGIFDAYSSWIRFGLKLPKGKLVSSSILRVLNNPSNSFGGYVLDVPFFVRGMDKPCPTPPNNKIDFYGLPRTTASISTSAGIDFDLVPFVDIDVTSIVNELISKYTINSVIIFLDYDPSYTDPTSDPPCSYGSFAFGQAATLTLS